MREIPESENVSVEKAFTDMGVDLERGDVSVFGLFTKDGALLFGKLVFSNEVLSGKTISRN